MTTPPLKTRIKEQAKIWWQASRPPFYIATLAPLLLGYVAAGKDTGHWRAGLFGLVLLCSFFLHLAANLANDVFDHLQGVDGDARIGGSHALQQGKISLRAYTVALVLLYSGAFVLGFVGVVQTGLYGIWAIIIFASLSSFFYVAPPIKYGYRGLGEFFVFLNMGVTMTAGTYYVLTGQWSARAVALSIPVGLMVAGILYYQSLPEIETDKAAGKMTLANLLGPKRAVLAFRLWWPVIWLLLLLLFVSHEVAWPVIAGIALCCPLYKKAVTLVENCNGDWLSLDAHGRLVRAMYIICSLSLIIARYMRT